MDEFVGGGVGLQPTQSEAQYYGNQKSAMARMPTMKERIDLAVQQAEERLVAAKRARELFDKNPDLEELLNLMQRSHF